MEALAAYEPYLGRPADAVAADLDRFAELLRKWNRTHNLVSRETEAELWTRHIADSLEVLGWLRETDRVVLDLGSGGGFPAIPLAIASGGRRAFILVEAVSKKASFLKEVSRQLGLGLRVEGRRAEGIAPNELPTIDVITARALAPVAELCRLAAPFFGPSTRALLHKGREHGEELAKSDAVWHHDVVVHPSRGGGQGVLLEISNLRKR
ncbi:MAG TPA: 16S rRNA (guanine(527)-N(7))-methyltransferase RsmG [Alphaproteobacteria bacterium]|nr:16S rRNA (guanine(527)-N(7))-methyltransferase RsmG [Alphaproteobacteria bacterium]